MPKIATREIIAAALAYAEAIARSTGDTRPPTVPEQLEAMRAALIAAAKIKRSICATQSNTAIR